MPLIARFTALLSVVLLLSGLAAPAAAAASTPLNLLIITADDMNGDTPGWMGDKLKVTPNLDQFAATAHRFVNAHVTVPICQPCRSAFMTGLVPHRNGALGFNPIRPGTPTLVKVLQAEGYHAGVIEKHVHMKPDSEFTWDMKLSGGGKNPAVMRQNLKATIKAAADAGKPFFINANITDPHRPFPGTPPRPNAGKGRKAAKAAEGKPAGEEGGGAGKNAGVAQPTRTYTTDEVIVPSFLEDLPALRSELARYFTAVGRLDETFGQIMAVLKETGHVDDTIVVFFSDHGISMPFAKATLYANGSRSPVLLRWPDMGQPQVREEFVSSVDLMPTLLELLSVKPPKQQDGTSWLPLLQGQTQPGRDHVVTHINTVSSGKDFTQRCVRTKDASLIFMDWPDGTEKFRVEAMSGQAYPAMVQAAEKDDKVARRLKQLRVGSKLAFYDLTTDPDERHNRISDRSRKQDIDRLASLLIKHMERTSDSRLLAFKSAMAEQFKQ